MKRNAFLILCLVISSVLFAQDENDILATAGKYSITAGEFKQRWDMSPQPGRKQGNNLEPSKKELLQTMIAEKILAQYAEKNGIDSLIAIRQVMKSYEETYLKDKLYKVEIDSKVNVTDKMISDAKKKNSVFMHVNFLFEEDSVQIYHLYRKLANGADFDSLLKARPEYNEQKKTVSVTYGTMEVPVENAVYSLRPGEYSKPVKNFNGYFIFSLSWIEEKKVTSEKEYDALHKKIKDMVYIREMDKFYIEFMRTFFRNKKVSSDGPIFYSLSNKIASKLSKLWADGHRGTTETKELGLSDSDLIDLQNSFGSDSLQMPFIKFDGGFVSLHDFLWNFQFNGFGISTSDKNKIISKFAEAVKLAGRDAVVANEAYKRDYQNDPEIRFNLELKKANLLAERVKGRVGSTVKVTENDVKEYYDKKYRFLTDSVAIKIIEIQFTEFENVKKILDRFNSGEAFSKLAIEFNENETLKKTDGVTVSFVPSQRGEIGRIASEMNLFEVKGPYKTGKYYSIFQLIEKQRIGLIGKTDIEPFDDIKDDLANQLYEKKYNEVLGKMIAKEAAQQNVTMNYSALEKVKVNSINLVAYQAMGFGGKILAVPFASPTFSWVKYWQEAKSQTP